MISDLKFPKVKPSIEIHAQSSKKHSFHIRMISASREVTGKSVTNNFTPKSKGISFNYYGGAFGGFKMSESEFPRRTNLVDRKKSVLKIATENFKLVKRL